MTTISAIAVQYYVDPAGNLYEMSEGGGIEGVELKEIKEREHERLKAKQDKAAEEQRKKEAEAALAQAQEYAALVEAARAELGNLGLSVGTVDLLLPVAVLSG